MIRFNYIDHNNSSIEGNGIKKKKYKYKGNASMRELIKNLELKREKELNREQMEVLKKQNQLYTKLLNI